MVTTNKIIAFAMTAIASYLIGNGVHQGTVKARRIELVNSQGKTTMVLDGESRKLSILDATGEKTCILMWGDDGFGASVVQIQSPVEKHGAMQLLAGAGGTSETFGTTLTDINHPEKYVGTVPFWAIFSAANSDKLLIQFASTVKNDSNKVETVQTWNGFSNQSAPANGRQRRRSRKN